MVARRRHRTVVSRSEITEWWSRKETDGSYRIGFTDDAQRRLGTVVYVRGPRAGRTYSAARAVMTLESEKCVRQQVLPGSGTVLESNAGLEAEPSAINRDPYGRGWVCRVRPSNARTLEATTERPPGASR